MGKLKSKFIEEKVFVGLMWIAVAVVLLVVASIIWTIFVKGIGAISWEMVSSAPGKNWNTADDGGFLNAIVGSLLVVAPATLIAMVVSIPVVFYMNLYRRRSNWLSYVARLVYDVLYGIPSIVYGAFAFMIMVMVGMRASLLGGIIVSTLLIIPMFIRSGDEISKSVPDDMIDAAFSLGATKWEIRMEPRTLYWASSQLSFPVKSMCGSPHPLPALMPEADRRRSAAEYPASRWQWPHPRCPPSGPDQTRPIF